ncbi:MAG: glycosyltransferase [Deltaproteobacteria bacterium]|nr:glycosyltransferase [Deltaproteobacteria bacterium]MBW1955074.1 glycosyltransferase [Deltaproteobacteria bacterium]MBW2042759.1 glycosyltransferase [Deltaproteobacteria bacterium]MBW2133140.1 glycosyltransferase [Deltaproteobacteria bacterium]
MADKPIVMVSSYPPRLCGIATFCEEAREFIQKANPKREVPVISHTDGKGKGVFPVIDMQRADWWKPVAEKIEKLDPYAVHIQHEYALYEYLDPRGVGDGNDGFLDLLEAISSFPIIVEPHTVHGRLTDFEADFIYKLCQRSHLVLFKCHYQKWRLDWTFQGRGWPTPRNVMVVPHGARPDKRWGVHEIPALRKAFGLERIGLADHVVGMIGWIQSNKRWDILLSMWEDIYREIKDRTGLDWDLLAAGTMRDPNHRKDYEEWKTEVRSLESKGIAHYYEFIPRGDDYYKMMAICDFIVLPSTDETQSGTLARIIAMNKPYITTAPMEGLTAQTLESEGGLLFTTKKMLRQKVIKLATDEGLRMQLGENLKRYLDHVVSWDIVARQYNNAYQLARRAARTGQPVVLDLEF